MEVAAIVGFFVTVVVGVVAAVFALFMFALITAFPVIAIAWIGGVLIRAIQKGRAK